MKEYILPLIVGFGTGILSAWGMGGGTLLIPLLTLLLGMDQHTAQGVNMLAFLPAAILSLLVHKKAGLLQWKEGAGLILPGIAGAVGGALIASVLQADWLRRLYGGFLILLAFLRAFRLLRGKNDKKP